MGRSRFCEGFPVPPERSLIRAQGLYRENYISASARGRVAAELGLPIECRIIVGIGYGDLRKGVDLFVRAAFTLRIIRLRRSSYGSARSTLPFEPGWRATFKGAVSGTSTSSRNDRM